MRKLFSFRPLVGLAAIVTTVSLVACDTAGNNGSSSPVTSGSASPSGVATVSAPSEVSPSSSVTASLPPPPSPPSSVTPSAQAKGQPGVPATPISEHETWPTTEGQNKDRQLDYKSGDNPSVKLPTALGDDLSVYAQQKIAWEACADGAECATMKVPLDWENPGKASLDIALTRKPSAHPSLGPLFFNPGGPGGPARKVVQNWKADAIPGYDFVGWDPRGVGESTHVECGTTEQTDAAWLSDSTPDDEAEKTAQREGWAGFARQCRDASGDLLNHVSTIETARDLDLLRHLLGAEKLNYLGVSYGTFIGATYAELFPERSGHLVLDSAVDISSSANSTKDFEEDDGSDKALEHFADWCAGDSSCSLGDDRDAILNRIDTFLKGLDTKPLAVGDLKLTQFAAAIGIYEGLYGTVDAYPQLAATIQQAIDGDGTGLLKAGYGYLDRNDKGWGQVIYAFSAISCIDHPDRGADPTTRSSRPAGTSVLSSNLGRLLTCEYWTADSVPDLKLTAKGAPPILVAGYRTDPATPYEGTVAMAEQLESGVLLTAEGEGHGVTFSGKNMCIHETVNKYLTTGEVPADGTSCPA